MAGKIGIFVCGCRGVVSDVVDPAAVADGLQKVKKLVGDKQYSHWLCGPGGRELLQQSIKANGLDCVLIAGCPEHVHRDYFREVVASAGLPAEMVLRLDIRESCALPHHDNPTAATQKAINLIKMWNGRAKLTGPYQPVKLSGNREVMIIGGGLAGLSTAAILSEAGKKVVVIEKEPYLGGQVARLNKVMPRMCDAACGVTYLMNRLLEGGRVNILTRSEIISVSGSSGRFSVVVRTEPRYVSNSCNGCGTCAEVCPVVIPDEYDHGLSTRKVVFAPRPLDPLGTYLVDRAICPPGCSICAGACPAGAIDLDAVAREHLLHIGGMVVATGCADYDVARVKRLGFAKHAGVITSLQMERLMAPSGPTGGNLLNPGTDRPVQRVAFIQCAGSRDRAYQPWCSTVCCAVTVKQALDVKDILPEAVVYVFYTDMRTPGEYEDLYVAAQEVGVVFVRMNPAEVAPIPGSEDLVVRGEDTLSGQILEVPCDLVVLATGLAPRGPARGAGRFYRRPGGRPANRLS